MNFRQLLQLLKRRRPEMLHQVLQFFDRIRGRSEVDAALHRWGSVLELLQADFFERARHSGKPKGLVWEEITWLPEKAFARDLETGLLTLFVAIEMKFSAIPDGDMDGIEAVGETRHGSAVFHYRNGRWGTGGRVLFNMYPTESIDRLSGQFEHVAFCEQ